MVGGGPAGLMAAEVAAARGLHVTVYDAKPSVGRKFLVAGKGGMNITHDELPEEFAKRYRASADSAQSFSGQVAARWTRVLEEFSPAALREWASGLGVETFTASTGRVYPVAMKSAPLLRRWVARLRSAGVEFRMRHQLRSVCVGAGPQLEFEAEPGEFARVAPDAVVLALGGGSWPQTGSTGDWVRMLEECGIRVNALEPSNCGWEVAWPDGLKNRLEGRPLKNVAATAGGTRVRGELLFTRYGLEGGIVYALAGALRELHERVLMVDFKPDSSEASLVSRLGSARRDYLKEAGDRWRLGETALDLLRTFRGEAPFASAAEVAQFVKNFPIRLEQPRPIAEAISTAGGVDWSELDESLMSRRLPGVFFAGEMIDWEAPTGGYLLQGCFALGARAGKGAAQYMRGA